MKWHKKDLGRLLNEAPDKPRFMVMSMDVIKGVLLWYAGGSPRYLPANVFRKEAVSYWTLQKPVPTIPAWLKVGTRFFLEEAPPVVEPPVVKYPSNNDTLFFRTLTELPELPKLSGSEYELEVQSIQYDYAACTYYDGFHLEILPLEQILELGYLKPTKWDILNEDED
jgi:hypothetical protein